MPVYSIDDVIARLEQIVQDSGSTNSTFGYFAALYLKVTKEVKKGIRDDFFEDGERMEQLDVIFAKRYLDAYDANRNNEAVTDSWEAAFEMAEDYWPIVLQHLLVGMNAHINLDLGIAAATVMKGKDIDDLHEDFNKINTILSNLVYEVEQNLAAIWPRLKTILKWTRGVDDFLVDFSMELARDGAWRFAKVLSAAPASAWEKAIHERDQKVAQKAKVVIQPPILVNLMFKIVRLGERGTVAQKIQQLNQTVAGYSL
jgi:hypothetical protein